VLNAEQQAVVDAVKTSKTIVVSACAGAGKTRVLGLSYKQMVESGVADPTQAVIVTYTQAAAAELAHRIRIHELPDPGFVGTLHGLMLRYLRMNGPSIGFHKGVSVVDERTANGFLREAMKRVVWKGTFEHAKRAVSRQSDRFNERTLFAEFHGKLAAQGLVTFDGILHWAEQALIQNQGKVPFSVLMVDEYQDVSRSDHDLYMRMVVERRLVVGDIRQAIFGFRGGDPNCMLELMAMPSFSHFKLTTNYRSARQIVEFANKLSPHLPDKELMRSFDPMWLGSFCEVFNAENMERHLETILEAIDEFRGNTAIICRFNWQIAAISEDLRKHDIAHRVHGKAKKPEDWDAACALVGFLANPESEVMAYAFASSVSQAKADELKRKANEECVSLCRLVWDDEHPDISEIEATLDSLNTSPQTKVLVMAIHDRLPEIDRSWVSLAAAMADPEALSQSSGDERVPLLCTIHAAKGREFDHVILPYWCDEMFPGFKKDDSEEWRLAYVAITRARKSVVILSCAEGRDFSGQTTTMTPSRFIKAITQ
jgi:DNA helicase-2/ATP-dependent DNA helicase PcrA